MSGIPPGMVAQLINSYSDIKTLHCTEYRLWWKKHIEEETKHNLTRIYLIQSDGVSHF